MKRYYTSKSLKCISNFYSYNYHNFVHKEVNYKKPKFDSNSSNSIMSRGTNPIG